MRLCILAVAVAVIVRTRVPLLPGWTVPAPVLLLAAGLAVSAALVAGLICRAYRPGVPVCTCPDGCHP